MAIPFLDLNMFLTGDLINVLLYIASFVRIWTENKTYELTRLHFSPFSIASDCKVHCERLMSEAV